MITSIRHLFFILLLVCFLARHITLGEEGDDAGGDDGGGISLPDLDFGGGGGGGGSDLIGLLLCGIGGSSGGGDDGNDDPADDDPRPPTPDPPSEPVTTAPAPGPPITETDPPVPAATPAPVAAATPPPTAAPTTSSRPTTTSRPSLSPSISNSPTISSRPSSNTSGADTAEARAGIDGIEGLISGVTASAAYAKSRHNSFYFKDFDGSRHRRTLEFYKGNRHNKFGLQHNQAMLEIEMEALRRKPADIDEYIDIVRENVQQYCLDEPDCLATIETLIDSMKDYVGEERVHIGNNKGNRRLDEIIPGYDLSDNATEMIERILFSLEGESERDIMNALNTLATEINLSVGTASNLEEHEKLIALGGISIALASTEYWFDVLREEENNVFRRLDEDSDSDSSDSEDEDDDSRKPSIPACIFGAGRYVTCDDCERRERNLRARMSHIVNGGLSKQRINDLSMIPVSKQLGLDDFYDDSERDLARDDVFQDFYFDDDWSNGGGHNQGGNNDLIPIDSESESSSGSSSEDGGGGRGIWLKRLRRIWFFVRADLFGFFVGAIISRICLPAGLAGAVVFSGTYVMCF